MLSAYIAVWVVVLTILVGRIFIVRTSRARPWGNALTTSLLTMFIASERVLGRALDGIAPGLRLLVFYLALVSFFLVALLFVLDCRFSRSSMRTQKTPIHQQVAAFLFTAVLLTVFWGASNGHLIQYPEILDEFSADLAPAYMFHVVANSYLGYSCVLLAINATGAARAVESAVRWVFYLASLASLAMLLGGPILRIPTLVVRWFSEGRSSVSVTLQSVGAILLEAGIAVFLGSLCALGLRVLYVLWREQKLIQRKVDRLHPAWEVLVAAIPDVAFRRRGRFSVIVDRLRRDLRFRYDKLSIEYEGALWRVSVYVDDSALDEAGPVSFRQRAWLVYEALVKIHRGVATATGPVLIVPVSASDDRPLLVLAAELGKLINRYGPPDRSIAPIEPHVDGTEVQGE